MDHKYIIEVSNSECTTLVIYTVSHSLDTLLHRCFAIYSFISIQQMFNLLKFIAITNGVIEEQCVTSLCQRTRSL